MAMYISRRSRGIYPGMICDGSIPGSSSASYMLQSGQGRIAHPPLGCEVCGRVGELLMVSSHAQLYGIQVLVLAEPLALRLSLM